MKILLVHFFVLTFFHLDTNHADFESCVCKVKEDLPTPPTGEHTLFYIQRTPNENTIMYDLNVVNGALDDEEPVHAYWLRYQEEGQKEELSYIQENYAYGLKSRKINANRYELRFVSYKKILFYLDHSPRDNRLHIQVTINGKIIEVNRVFLQIEGGSFWFPNVVCAEVRGIDPTTGIEVIQTLKP